MNRRNLLLLIFTALAAASSLGASEAATCTGEPLQCLQELLIVRAL